MRIRELTMTPELKWRLTWANPSIVRNIGIEPIL